MWRNLRDRWLGDPAVRAAVARWPFGRAIARRHADRLFGVVAGFVGSQALLAATELGVFEALAVGPRAWDGLTDLPPAGADALLQALIATGLIERRGSQVALTLDGLVVATDPGLRAMIAHNRLLYADLADPVATFRGAEGRIAALWPYRGAGDPKAYGALMAASLGMVADDVLRVPALARARSVTDIGGGSGAFLARVRQRWPEKALTLVDLPLAVAGLTLPGITVVGAAPNEPLPPAAEVITLLRLLHDQTDAAAATLLARVAAALPPGGRVIVAEPLARSGRDPQTAYFAGYFAAMGSGRLRTRDEVEALLRGAGLERIRWQSPGILADLAVAQS